MLRFRPKLGSERDKEWRCFFCLHVRTGTILLGAWHLMLHLVALGLLALIIRHPKLLDQLDGDYKSNKPIAQWSYVIPTPLSNMEEHPNPQTQSDNQPSESSIIYHDVDVGALVTVCTLAITLMLIYGASRGKPAHLLPFFCLQIFDFAITVLTAMGYLCYLHSIHRLVAETRRVPWRVELLQLPAPLLALVVFLTFLFGVTIKAYCISVVWRCYKYLTMRAHALQSLTPFVISGDTGPTPAPQYQYPDHSTLLPNYEEAVKQNPPPSYLDATLMAPQAIVTPATPAAEAVPAPQAATPAAPAHTVVMLPQGEQARV